MSKVPNPLREITGPHNLLKNRSMAKAISNVGWHQLTQQLIYKAQRYGHRFVQIDKWYPSSTHCFHCSHITDKMSLTIRIWVSGLNDKMQYLTLRYDFATTHCYPDLSTEDRASIIEMRTHY